jgi:hypothetical protein
MEERDKICYFCFFLTAWLTRLKRTLRPWETKHQSQQIIAEGYNLLRGVLFLSDSQSQ